MLLFNFLLPLLSLLPFTAAQSNNNASAVFVYDGYQNAQFVFALTVDKSSRDLYFHIESPVGNAWVGVGIGDEMKNALMFIAYAGEDGETVTISPRIASGNSEPTYQSYLTIKKQSENGLQGANTVTGRRNTLVIKADGVCRGCTTWPGGGSIDLTSTHQPFIFAVGPTFPPIESDSLSAGLSRHEFYGHFTMDMTAATSSSGGSVPVGPYELKDASKATNTTFDNDPAPHIHGLVMSLVFILLLPLGSLLLRVWKKVKGHIVVQCIALVLFCMAFAGGCVVSQQYNKSKHFNSAHQIIGILLLVAFFTQLALGIIHHRIYKKEQRATIMGKIHLYLGPAIIFFGLLNGGIGFSFAGANFLAIPYVIIILLVIILYSCIRCGTTMFRKRRGKQEGPEGFQHPQFGHPQPPYAPPPDGPPPAYPPPYSQQDVPLTRFESSHSVPRMDAPPVQPRPMI